MLDTKAYMNSATLEDVVFNAHIPSCHLENVEQILRHVFWLHWLVHDIFYWPEFELPIATFLHQTFIYK